MVISSTKQWGDSEVFPVPGQPQFTGVILWFGDLIVLEVVDNQRRPVAILNLDLRNKIIERALVAEEHRHKGLCTYLISMAIDVARKSGLDRVSVTIDPSNQVVMAMMEKFGWSKLIHYEKRLDL